MVHTDSSTLASFTADYWQLSASDVTDGLAFAVNSIPKFTSIRFYRFIAAVEDTFGGRVPDPAGVPTFGALRAVLGSPPSGPEDGHTASEDALIQVSSAPAHAKLDVIGVGHDIEDISSLPETTDFRSHSFYKAHFTQREIDYCLQSTNPRQHFAARFCAKEAVRKCGPDFAALDPHGIEVVNTESGQPSIRLRSNGLAEQVRVLVSLSHSQQLASAFVVVANAQLR